MPGVAKLGRLEDLEQHRLRPVANKRCPSCAARLAEKRVGRRCPECDTVAFADSASLHSHLASLAARLPKTLAICFGLGSVPLLGLIPGILHYRVSLTSSLRFYVPGAVGFGVCWLDRLLNLFLLVLQIVPVVGALTLPLMCWLIFRAFSAAVRRQARGLDEPGPCVSGAPESGSARRASNCTSDKGV